MNPMLKYTLSVLTLALLGAVLAVPLAAQTADDVIANFLENTGGARVVERDHPNYTVEFEGRLVYAHMDGDGPAYEVTLTDEAGQTMARIIGDDKTVTLTDDQGNTVVGPAGRLDRDATVKLFEPAVLIFADAGNLAKIRDHQVLALPNLTWGQPPMLDLCCDPGTVSNCFPPGSNGTCGPTKELVACTHGNCEINGTWNCC